MWGSLCDSVTYLGCYGATWLPSFQPAGPFPTSSQWEPVKTSLGASPQCPLFSSLLSISHHTASPVSVRPPVLILPPRLCSLLCWKRSPLALTTHPQDSLLCFLGLLVNKTFWAVLFASSVLCDPPSWFVFLHSTYNLPTYCVNDFIIIICLFPLDYKPHESRDFCLFY